MNKRPLARLAEHAWAFSAMFGAVTLANLEFVEHALPSRATMFTPPAHVVLMISVFIIMPAAVLFAIDRAIALGASARTLRVFRAGVLGLAMFFIARQLQMYNGSVGSLTEPFTSHWMLSAGLAAVVLAGLLALAYRAQRQATVFFQYLGVVAVPLLLVSLVQLQPEQITPPGYDRVVVPQQGGGDQPVFVFVFDELSYDVLAADDSPDREAFPNFAALADEGVWFTNATTNYFHTQFVIPSMLIGLEPLTKDYQLWAYPQFGLVEGRFFAKCGVLYTCRGPARTIAEHPRQMFSYISERWLYEVLPDAAAGVAAGPVKGVLGDFGGINPAVDPHARHIFTKSHFQQLLSDISADESRGRIYFFHTLVTHHPYLYDRTGGPASSAEDTTFDEDQQSAAVYARYREQAMYADAMLGEFIATLKVQGLYEDAVIVLTADHGLRRVPSPAEAIPVDQEVARVPLLIRAPGLAPAVSGVDYQHMDFGATLADVLDEQADAAGEGISAFAEERPLRDKVHYISDPYRDRYWKYVAIPGESTWRLVAETEGNLAAVAFGEEAPPLSAAIED